LRQPDISRRKKKQTQPVQSINPMKTFAQILMSLLLVSGASAQERPWQQISDPTADQLAANFATPPAEYSAQFDCGFSDTRTREAIGATLDRAKSVGVQAAFIEPGRGNSPYLSPGYFDAVKVLVEEAKKRNMKLWFDDDGGYPSGFAGGKFSVERPDLRMKALAAPQRVTVTNGQQYASKLDAQTICVLAVNRDTGAAQVLDSSSGTVNWTVPAAGNWEIALPRFQFRSGPTRSANNSNGQKNGEHSLMDFLNPESNKLFDQWTFDAYKQAIGDELGKTVLGFRGDEPSFGFNPWSPVLLAEFQKRKGYDLRPYLATVASINIGGRGGRGGAAPAGVNLDESHRVFADYYDVWSDLFGENFFGGEGRWAAENHVEIQMHIEHEENLPGLATADGDFFKCLRSVQVPGIDTIWHQIWHDVTADFPKLASSATHLNGNPRAMCEAFAAYNPVPDLKEATWILNHLMVLGINRIEYMGLQGTGPFRNFYGDPGFPAVSLYVNRATYALGEGRPAAQIGVYIPSSSFWFNDSAANTSFLAIVHQLLQHQRDLDFVDEYALSKTLKLQGSELINQSGQAYRAIVVPPVDAISKAALDNLRAFAKAGGKVIFLGNAPKLVMDKNFLTATGPADISWAVFETASEITPKVLAVLPAPDVATDQETTWLKYNHRRMKDADLYFFFNEGDQPLSLKTTVLNSGTARQAQNWDATTGKIEPWDGATFASGKTTLPLDLQPWGTKIVVIK
jgi:hypothetical protein